MTFVTAGPYIGHLGVGGVDDTKGVLDRDAPAPYQMGRQRQRRQGRC
jgi:hypothetical protein